MHRDKHRVPASRRSARAGFVRKPASLSFPLLLLAALAVALAPGCGTHSPPDGDRIGATQQAYSTGGLSPITSGTTVYAVNIGTPQGCVSSSEYLATWCWANASDTGIIASAGSFASYTGSGSTGAACPTAGSGFGPTAYTAFLYNASTGAPATPPEECVDPYQTTAGALGLSNCSTGYIDSTAHCVTPPGFVQPGFFGIKAPMLPGTCPSPYGMCEPTASTTSATLALHDIPSGYAPQKGPDVHIDVSYSHADTVQPATPNYSNLGPRWTHKFLSYVTDNPTTPGSNVTRYVMGGGQVNYATETSGFNSGTGVWGPELQGAAVLTRNPASGTLTSYTLTLPDGSVQTFAHPDGATSYPRNVLLTGVTDPQGNSLAISYDGSNRLTTIVDAESRTTTFNYSGSSLLIASITDPFGRSASFSYDGYGRLSSIQDVLGITSSFTYDNAPGADAGADGGPPGDPYFINQLTAPYGTSHFAGGTDYNASTSWLELTDPDGNTERVEFDQANAAIADTESSTPSGMTVENGMYGENNTYYWDKYVYPTYGTGGGKDYTKAEITHWALSGGKATGIVASVKKPLENRVYYTYPGQSGGPAVGTYDKPSAIGRVLDDATSQVSTFTYNTLGNVTKAVDPLGRTTTYTYDTNNIDLLTVKQLTASGPTYSTIAAYTNNGLHEPLTYTDAASQVWTNTYNGAGQLLTVTDPLSNVTTNAYDGTGRITTITDANSTTYATFTYSGTCGGGSHINCDVPSSIADSEGRTVAYARDALDRITTTTYPDGTTDVDDYTFQSGTYSGTQSLEARKHTDRLGRVTTRGFDAERRLTSLTEPTSGSTTRTTSYDYYADGTLKDLIDANSNDTRWAIDTESRPTSKTYAYGTGSAETESYAYETSTSRTLAITDALSQVKTFAYDEANERTGITYTSSVHTTPNVSWTWDSHFPRQTSMTDGTGTTNYTYTAIGSNGALKLSSNAGPYSNDTTGLTYDADGRMSGRTISGANETWTYDPLSRVSHHATGTLTNFVYSYLGETEQPSQRYTTYGGTTILTSWTHDTNTNDRRLIAIGNSNVSRSYTLSYGAAADGGGTQNPYDIQSITEVPATGHPFSGQTLNYTYDLRDRLLTANNGYPGNYTFGYDKLDNATTFNIPGTSTSPTYNGFNQLSTWGTLSYVYDADGNVTSGDGVHTYKWNAENELIEIDYVGTANKSVFTYNGIGERISDAETVSGTTTTTRYLWCGDQICQVRDGSDVVQHRNVEEGVYYPTGPGFHAYLIDQLGSVRDAVDLTSGNFVQAFDYAPYGAQSAQYGYHYADYDYQYAGLFAHQASGIYFSGTRPYDPNTGKWLQRDLIRESGGANLYGYAGGNPISNVDPSGLRWEYSQASGQWTHVDNQTGARAPAGTGYSGHDEGVNNPAMQNVPRVGPIPQGSYNIAPQQDNVTGTGTSLPGSMRLTPIPGTDTFGRSGFIIHGDNNHRDNTASEGCPIANRTIRNTIARSGDRRLQVVP